MSIASLVFSYLVNLGYAHISICTLQKRCTLCERQCQAFHTLSLKITHTEALKHSITPCPSYFHSVNMHAHTFQVPMRQGIAA